MTHSEKFRKFMRNQGYFCDKINAVWFTSNYGYCYPEDYIGENILNDIIDKFYYPLQYLKETVEKKHPELNGQIYIIVMPNYEGCTYYTMHTETKVLLTDGEKPWNFSFDSEKEFDEWAEQTLNRIEQSITRAVDDNRSVPVAIEG